MNTYKRHRFQLGAPHQISFHAIWLYYRFNLSTFQRLLEYSVDSRVDGQPYSDKCDQRIANSTAGKTTMSKPLHHFFVTALLLTTGLIAPTVSSGSITNAALTAEQQAKITPQEALAMLQRGNQRFVDGTHRNVDFIAQVKQTSHGQFPFAAIVSCLDSRIPPAIVFDRNIGDLFVGRVAGNFVNDDTLGSLEFATKLAGAKLIVVMGHSECGAVKGACDGAQLGLLTTTLANINPAVRVESANFSPADSSNKKFVQAVAEKNVELNIQKLLDRSLVLREMEANGEIKVVGAMYDVHSGVVTFL